MSMRRRRRLLGGGSLGALVASLGGDASVPAIYDVRAGVTAPSNLVTQWDDARGATGFGPSLTASGSARPTFDPVAQTITFDGVGTFLRASAGRLSEITADCGLCLVGVGSTNSGQLVELSQAATTRALLLFQSSNQANYLCNTNGTGSPATPRRTGIRALHVRRTASVNAVQDGNVTEVTSADAPAAVTVDRLTVGASRDAVPVAYCVMTLRALVIVSGTYAGDQTALNAWAQSIHGAAL